MSYDVEIGDWQGNYTYNLGAFFRWAFEPIVDDGLNSLHELSAFLAKPLIEDALKRIFGSNREELRSRFTPSNYWGSVEGAIRFLEETLAACESARPTDRVRIS